MAFEEYVIEIGEHNYDEFFENQLAILHFFSDWHMNCLMTLPIVEDVAADFCEKEQGICFGKVNIDEYEDFAKKHKITCVPALLFFKDGEEVDRIESQIQDDLLRERITSLLQLA